ncbi:HAD-IA family hydrolase [Paenibacillus apiarius]|uniref:HAD-IA family hydrolase n=2 Tax=Paenibacillus apiarius TaxID=46240 RepID=UPI003AB964EF
MLREVKKLADRIDKEDRYPFHVPVIQHLDTLQIRKNVTFFVGENGSGKSTLVEAITYQCGFNTAGGGRNNQYELESSEARLGDYIRLSWMPKVNQGFFLRAESFYHFASHIDEVAREDRSIYQYYGGRSLHEQSHGESFLALFKNRFGRKGIYLLDEPEAALSPARQLAFLSIIHEMQKNAQLIIATHSPILLGYPNADIYNFDVLPVQPVAYEDTDHYQDKRQTRRVNRMIQALVFDFDGLIIDTETPWYYAFQQVYQRYGFELPLSVYAQCIGTTFHDFNPYANLAEQAGVDVEVITRECKTAHAALMERIELRAGVRDYLKEAKRLNLKVGIASSSEYAWIEPLLKKHDIYHYFDTVQTADVVAKVKPDPELYVKALAALEVEGKQAISFEDSLNGFTAAKAAGLNCVVVPNEVTRHLPFTEHDLMLTSMSDMPLAEVITKLSGATG